MAFTFDQLGLLAEERGDVRQAVSWAVRCIAVFGEVPHPLTGTGPRDLARFTAATLAWTIYSGLRNKKPEVAERELRVELRRFGEGGRGATG
jgi:hypothetical protein